jgi:hypothetical protein
MDIKNHPNRVFLEQMPLRWAQRRLRNKQPTKLKNFHYIKKFNDTLLEVYDEYVEMYDVIGRFNLSRVNFYNYNMNAHRLKHLLYSEGSPNFQHFTLTPSGEYAVGAYNPMYHLWKDFETDPNILPFYRSLGNNKYEQPKGSMEIGQPYNLFLLQMARTRDTIETIKALLSTRVTKKLTIFKTHPLVGDGSNYHDLWKYYIELGLINEYTKLVDNCNVDSLIRNADLVYSSDSAATMNAMLIGKPVITYKRMYLSEIVPILTNHQQLLNLQPVPEEHLARWMSWYYHKLVIDLDDPNYKEKMRYIVKSYLDNKTVKEIFGNANE